MRCAIFLLLASLRSAAGAAGDYCASDFPDDVYTESCYGWCDVLNSESSVLFGLILCGACCLPIVQTLRGGGRSHAAHARVRVEEDDASDDDDDGGMYPARNGRYSM